MCQCLLAHDSAVLVLGQGRCVQAFLPCANAFLLTTLPFLFLVREDAFRPSCHVPMPSCSRLCRSCSWSGKMRSGLLAMCQCLLAHDSAVLVLGQGRCVQ